MTPFPPGSEMDSLQSAFPWWDFSSKRLPFAKHVLFIRARVVNTLFMSILPGEKVSLSLITGVHRLCLRTCCCHHSVLLSHDYAPLLRSLPLLLAFWSNPIRRSSRIIGSFHPSVARSSVTQHILHHLDVSKPLRWHLRMRPSLQRCSPTYEGRIRFQISYEPLLTYVPHALSKYWTESRQISRL